MSNLGVPKFQGSKTSSQSKHMYKKGKKIPPVIHIWATMLKHLHFGYSGDTKRGEMTFSILEK